MENRLFVTVQDGQPAAADPLLKATALLYLKDALAAERYEECALLIQNAKDCGASTSEVSDTIASYARQLRLGRKGANVRKIRRFS